MLVEDMKLVPDELVNMITKWGFHFDSSYLQDRRSMVLPGMVLHFGHIGQDF